jgi:hypothetical protein
MTEKYQWGPKKLEEGKFEIEVPGGRLEAEHDFVEGIPEQTNYNLTLRFHEKRNPITASYIPERDLITSYGLLQGEQEVLLKFLEHEEVIREGEGLPRNIKQGLIILLDKAKDFVDEVRS